MIAPLSAYDAELYEISYGQVSSCRPQNAMRRLVNVKRIVSVISSQPHQVKRARNDQRSLILYGDAMPRDHYVEDRLAIIEKPGLGMATAVYMDDDEEE